MGTRLLSLVILLSVALNGAFVATWLSQVWLPTAADNCEACCPLYQQIGASDSQRQEIEPRLASFRRSAQELCRQIEQRRQELLDLIAAPQVDRAALRAKQEEILQGQRQMQELIVEHLLREKTVLTPQQQKVLFDLIRTRCGCTDAEEL